MHYGDSHQKTNQKLRVIVYKHAILGTPPAYKEDGALTKESVFYQVTSIRECHLFNPSLLTKIIKDPYKYLNKELSDKPFDKWYEIAIAEDVTKKGVNIRFLGDRSTHPDESKRLH